MRISDWSSDVCPSDLIVAIQDMGAAGLTSSSVEMASKGGVGLELVLDDVPCRETGMTPYEMMLSESQERMLMILKPGREGEAERSEEHTSELQSLMRISYAVFCLKKKNTNNKHNKRY